MTIWQTNRGCDYGVRVAGSRAWPIDWEQHVNEACAHRWEVCSVVSYDTSREVVVRCRECHVPRCGHWVDENPCMERRHHRDIHIYLDGSFEPVGGMLR